MKRIKNLIMPYMVLFVTGEQPLGRGTHAQIFQMYRYESLSLSLSLSLLLLLQNIHTNKLPRILLMHGRFCARKFMHLRCYFLFFNFSSTPEKIAPSKEVAEKFIKVVLPNFGIKSVPGDGLCIIHAFRESLSYIGRNQTLEQIKGALRQEMPHYQKYSDTNVITQLDKYLEDPLNEYEKNTTVDFFLPAFGRAYGVNVLIFQSDCEKCVILDDSVHTDNALHKNTLYFVRTLSLPVDPVVPLSSLPFVSSDADDSDVDIIEVIDKSVDKKKMLKLEK